MVIRFSIHLHSAVILQRIASNCILLVEHQIQAGMMDLDFHLGSHLLVRASFIWPRNV